jgi:pimeloyl-ACP methyl ester carboxylesterase
VPKKVTSKDGTIIAYDAKGKGPALILILGALNKRGSGKKLAELLADKFTVVSYDRRGRGDSTNTLPYSTNKEVEDIDALIDALGGNAYLYGHSSGAILALMAAEKLSAKVKRLAVYELPYDADPAAQATLIAYRKEMKRRLTANKPGDAVALFVTSVGVTNKQIEAMKKLPLWKGLSAMAPTLAYDTIELMEQYTAQHTQTIDIPVLVLFGESSPSFMENAALELTHALQHAELRGLEGQHHDVKADVLAPHLINFFIK